MHQILYMSNCQIPDEDLESEIGAILASAMRHNRRDGITGLFLLVGNRFLQLIEGEEPTLHKCMNRIEADHRHSGITILIQRPIEKRLFPKWSMHYFRMSEEQALEKLGVGRIPDLAITNWEAGFKDNLAIVLLESFARLGSI